MFKGFSLFYEKYGDDAITEYFKVLKKYKFKFGISKYSHHTDHINLMTRMNFQYLQCLDLENPKYIEHYKKLWSQQDDDYNILDENNFGKILNLAKYSTDLFKNIAGGSKYHTMKFLGATDSAMSDEWSNYIKAIYINDIMLKDPCIRRSIIRKCQKMIDDMKIGKIFARGFYHTIVGDIIGYLEYISGKEPIGILKYGEFYTNTIFKDGQDVLSFRSPLVCPSEVNAIKIRTGEEFEKWFGHFKNQDIAMVNMYDLTMPIQGGCDFDGDSVFLSDEPILVNNKINKTIVVDIDDKVTIQKVEYNKENIVKYELNSRDERIGEITNVATSILNKYTEDENQKKTYEDYISYLRLCQGKEIDSIKTGVRWNMPRRLRNHLKKLPYFLIYNYESKRNRYFNILEENKKLPKGEKLPKNIYNSPSAMNELCSYICKWEKAEIKWNTNLATPEEMLEVLIDKDIEIDEHSYILKQFQDLYRKFNKDWKEILNEKNEENFIQLDKCLNRYKSLILGFSDDRKLLANYLIDVAYSTYNSNKILCWHTFGDEMIQNLIKNSSKSKSLVFVEDLSGSDYDFEYLGKYYKAVSGE